jgi:hypothetical protein
MSYGRRTSATATITAGETTHETELPAGLHNVYFHVGNPFDEVSVAVEGDNDRACVYEMDAGLVTPLEPVT